jgi:hypothetical protein
MKILTSLSTARVLVILGLLVTLVSVAATIGHLGKEEFMFRGTGAMGATHAWHHLFREATHDIGAMIGLLFLMFAGPRYRNTWMWWGMMFAAIGLYAGYWLGLPINPGYGAPMADAAHIPQAVLVIAGLLVARRHYQSPAITW